VKPIVLDLFSGTGSATQPFVECGKHRVVRIDIAGKPDIRADVRRLPLDPDLRPEFVWASPPCTEFSFLTKLAAYQGYRPMPDPEKGMELVRATFDYCRRSGAPYLIENVRGAVPFISKEFGRPQAEVGAWFLWGNAPGFLMPKSNRMYKMPLCGTPRRYQDKYGKWKIDRRNRSESRGSKGSKIRAMIPRPLAEAVHRAVCEEVRGT
jgi:hypothetical protein